MLIKHSSLHPEDRELDEEFVRNVPNIDSVALLPSEDPEHQHIRLWVVTYFQRSAVHGYVLWMS